VGVGGGWMGGVGGGGRGERGCGLEVLAFSRIYP
jgi:hypothetical protein